MFGNRIVHAIVVAFGLALCFAGGVHAQSYPTKPIKLILPNTTG